MATGMRGKREEKRMGSKYSWTCFVSARIDNPDHVSELEKPCMCCRRV